MNNTPYDSYQNRTMASTVSSVMKRVYFKMTLGLLVSAFVSLWASQSSAFWTLMYNHSWLMWGLLIAEVGIVIAITAAINKLSSPVASLLFYVFAAVNGLTLAPIFLAYAHETIATTFFVTAGTFAAMSIYGYFTSNDLSRMGSILIMALFGIIIATLVNLFIKS